MENKKVEKTAFTNAQKEMQTAFLGGFAGQLVAGLIWIASAAISVFHKPLYGMLFLFFGSMAIFPLTQMTLRMMGRSAKVSSENGLWGLGSQVAFTVPLNFLLVGAVILYRPEWFYPAAMIVVGTHYLPFITLYGIKIYGALSVLLVLSGLGLALYGPPIFSLGGWLTGLILIIFALLFRRITLIEEKKP